jgi:hypothetical protein
MKLDVLARSLAPLAAFVAGAFGHAAAQQPPRPDCSAPEHRQFDFWVGDWDVTNPAGKAAGTSHITKILGDCVLHEDWSGAGGGRGQSFNIWSRADGKWHQSWVSDAGVMLLLAGGLQGGSMVLEGDSKGPAGAMVRNRITWSIVDGNKDRVRQHWMTSPDGGTTWTTAFDGTYRRR